MSIIECVATEPQVGDEAVLTTGKVRYRVFLVEGDGLLADREETFRTEDGGKPTARELVRVDLPVWKDLVLRCCATASRAE